jgi:hypothetical protein
MNRELVMVDVDDVLAQHNEALARFAAEQFGAVHEPDAYHGNLATVWNVSEEEAIERMWAFTHADVHEFDVVEGAIETIGELYDDFRFMGLSAQPKMNAALKGDWVARHFTDLLEEMHYVHPWDGDKTTKGERCVELGASVLIDNSVKHCLSAARLGITAVLFGKQLVPEECWSENLVVAPSWRQVGGYLRARP